MTVSFIRTLPHTVYVAFSGGVDSVVVAHKLISQRRDVTLAFYHHGNEFADQEESFVDSFAKDFNVPVIKGRCQERCVGSKEKFWRDSRYEFFRKIQGCVATGHNLDDAVEWYMMTAIRGEPHYMEYRHANVVRPLLLTRKSSILEYANKENLKWLEDPSNSDTSFTARNKVRHEILPACFEINPGLHTTIANQLRRRVD